jgi:hypothetical protein
VLKRFVHLKMNDVGRFLIERASERQTFRVWPSLQLVSSNIFNSDSIEIIVLYGVINFDRF